MVLLAFPEPLGTLLSPIFCALVFFNKDVTMMQFLLLYLMLASLVVPGTQS
jgi:hypothetical protein